MQRRILRIADLATRPGRPGMLPLSESTIRRLVISGRFPKPYFPSRTTIRSVRLAATGRNTRIQATAAG